MTEEPAEEIAALNARLAALEAGQADPSSKPPTPKSPGANSGCLIILVVAAILAVMVTCKLSTRSPEEIAAQAQAKADADVRVAGRMALEARLKDPRSVQFGALTVSRKSGAAVLCGYYNAKNSFGGYVGEKRFFVAGPLAILENDFGEPAFSREWSARCD